MGKFVASIERPKVIQLQGASPTDQGLCTWTLIGTYSRYRLMRATALAMGPCPPPKKKTNTVNYPTWSGVNKLV